MVGILLGMNATLAEFINLTDNCDASPHMSDAPIKCPFTLHHFGAFVLFHSVSNIFCVKF